MAEGRGDFAPHEHDHRRAARSHDLNSSSFIGVFQAVAGYVNYFLGFALVVFLFLIFGWLKWTISESSLPRSTTK
jgi:hypothetical protein